MIRQAVWTCSVAIVSGLVAVLVVWGATDCTATQKATARTAADVVRAVCVPGQSLDACTRKILETSCGPVAQPIALTVVELVGALCSPGGTVEACVDTLLGTCPLGLVDAGPGKG